MDALSKSTHVMTSPAINAIAIETAMDKMQFLRLGFWPKIFWKMKWSCPLKETNKQRTVFVANDKIKSFQWKLEFLKTWNSHCEPDLFPI